MSLNYEKAQKSSAENASVWSSYSDLFMVLSLVFLLLYVVAGLRTSTHSIRNTLAYKELQHEASDLREQIQVYNTLKESYLEKSAGAEEEKVYEQLMSKLTLLQEDAEREKIQLENQAAENSEKAKALNHYQQIVRNLINANVLAKAGLQSRDKIIAKKNESLQLKDQVLDLQKAAIGKQLELIQVKETQLASQEEQLSGKRELIREKEAELQAKRGEIEALKRSVAARESEIDRNNRKMSEVSARLERQMEQLNRQKQQQELSAASYAAEVAELRQASAKQIQALTDANQEVKESLRETEQSLRQAGENLTIAKSKLNKQQEEKQSLEQKLEQAKTSLVTANLDFSDNISKLKREFQVRLAAEKRQFAEEMNGLEMTLAERRAEEAAFKADALQQERNLNETIAQLSSKAELDAAETSALQADRAELQKKIAAVKQQFARETSQMKAEFDAAMKAKSRAFADQLDEQELTGKQKLEEERKFREAAVADTKNLMAKLDKLDDRLQASENRLSEAKKDRDDHKEFVAALRGQNRALSADLAKSHKAMKAKKQIIAQLKDSFAKAGIDAEIDPNSGDMMLSFGDDYFDTDSASVKPGMRQTLEDHIPTYAKSLFQRPEIVENLASVEIVGFSSPTYGGKYVDPSSLDEADRAAVNYNLDLSYRRARSIFQYIFDTSKMNFPHQPELLRLIKVTGRSFLSEDMKGRTLERGLSRQEFCRQYDCLKSQRVLIKFNIKD